MCTVFCSKQLHKECYENGGKFFSPSNMLRLRRHNFLSFAGNCGHCGIVGGYMSMGRSEASLAVSVTTLVLGRIPFVGFRMNKFKLKPKPKLEFILFSMQIY